MRHGRRHRAGIDRAFQRVRIGRRCAQGYVRARAGDALDLRRLIAFEINVTRGIFTRAQTEAVRSRIAVDVVLERAHAVHRAHVCGVRRVGLQINQLRHVERDGNALETAGKVRQLIFQIGELCLQVGFCAVDRRLRRSRIAQHLTGVNQRGRESGVVGIRRRRSGAAGIDRKAARLAVHIAQRALADGDCRQGRTDDGVGRLTHNALEAVHTLDVDRVRAAAAGLRERTGQRVQTAVHHVVGLDAAGVDVDCLQIGRAGNLGVLRVGVGKVRRALDPVDVVTGAVAVHVILRITDLEVRDLAVAGVAGRVDGDRRDLRRGTRHAAAAARRPDDVVIVAHPLARHTAVLLLGKVAVAARGRDDVAVASGARRRP